MSVEPTSDDQGPKPEMSTRHFIGVTESGLRIGTAITARFMPDAEYRPIPMSALRGDGDDLLGRIASAVLKPDDSSTLWPVSEAVYREWNDDDNEGDALDVDDDEDDA